MSQKHKIFMVSNERLECVIYSAELAVAKTRMLSISAEEAIDIVEELLEYKHKYWCSENIKAIINGVK